MKKLLWLLLFCIAPLYAEEIAWTKNNNGGLIVLTNKTCYLNGRYYENIFAMYSIAGSGQTINGCYMVDGSFVRVVYEDGTEYRYPAGTFTIKNKPSRNSI